MFVNTLNQLYNNFTDVLRGGVSMLNRLVQARQNAKMSQTKIAEILNIPQQQYSRYETGQNEIPVRHVITLCKVYGVSADWLLGLTEE